jgi:hypothetical protein
VEVDLGSSPIFSGSFVITDSSFTPTSRVLVWQAPGPYTGKGTLADEAAMAPVVVISVEPVEDECLVRWETPPIVVAVPQLVGSGGRNATGILEDVQARHLFTLERRGRVRGNIKFSYVIFN